jgi:hypothetical protein
MGENMSDKPRHQKKPVAQLTPEQLAEQKIAREKAAADAKAEAERIQLFGERVEKMTHKQLAGELRRTIRREYAGKPPQPQAGLNILYGSVLLTVLENTQTKENPFAKLSSYLR